MPETTQPWNLIPYADQPNRDDELLLVIDGENTRRITQKKYIYDQMAELSWVVDGSINIGIGTPNVWGNVLFNVKEGPSWIELNSDGSFTLEPGSYLMDAEFSLGFMMYARARIFSDSVTLLYKVLASSNFESAETDTMIRLRKKVSITEQETYTIQVNVSSARSNAFFKVAGTLSGFSPTIAQCFIWRLG